MTEDITGAIADSINYAIEALRELVTTVNESVDSRRCRGQADRGDVAASRAFGRDAGQAGGRCVGLRGQDGGLDRGGIGQCRALRRRRAPRRRRRAQRRRGRAPHDRRHEHDSRDHSGHLQAYQAARRELSGDRQYRRAHRGNRRADEHPRAQRLDRGLARRRSEPRFRGRRRRGAKARRALDAMPRARSRSS